MLKSLVFYFFFPIFYNTNTFANYVDVSELPDKPISQVIEPMISAINSGQRKKVVSFINSHYSEGELTVKGIKKLTGYLLNIREIHGRIEFHSSRSYDRFTLPDYELHAVLKPEKTNMWLGVVVVAAESAPSKLMQLRFIPARHPSNVAKPGPLSIELAVAELDNFVDAMAKMDLFSGAVLLAEGEQIIFQRADGEASKRFNVPNKLDTKFNLGSLNKMFTGLAIMQQVEKGTLSLNDKLRKHIDSSWLNDGISKSIEIQHLLTHTSGLDNNFLRAMEGWPKQRFRKLSDYKTITKKAQQFFEPGTSLRYSNTSMFLLGVVIESVTGQDYFQYLQENVFEPAGMINTGSFEMDEPIPNLAIGYRKENKSTTGWRNNLFSHVLKGSPAGGGFSTIYDLHRFSVSLRQHKLLSKDLTELMFTPKPELNSPAYGYGFSIRNIGTMRVVGHEGGTVGINSNLDVYLERPYVTVIMSNYSDGSVHIMRKMRELLERVK